MDTFILQPEGGLLQSPEWMAVARAEGKNVVEVRDGSRVAYGIVHRLSLFGEYVYFPRLCSISYELQKKIVALPYPWIRMDVCDDAMLNIMRVDDREIYKAPHDMQPRTNLIFGITEASDSLMAKMKSKTRYNIRLAQKRGVIVHKGNTQQDIDRFYALVEQTERRKGIDFHDKAHYESIVRILGEDHVTIYSALYDDVVVAANIVLFYNGVATYLHGATSDMHRSVMAPYFLQWAIMQDAKDRGCIWYDLGGVFPESEDIGKMGITRFKSGFAPQERFYDTKGSYDIVRSSWRYRLYTMMRNFRSV